MSGCLERATRNGMHAILSAEQWDETIEALREVAKRYVQRPLAEPTPKQRAVEGALRAMLAARGRQDES